jgi:hypothetical protein
VTNAQGCKREESGRAIEGRDKERCKLTRLARLAATEATTSTDTACVCVCVAGSQVVVRQVRQGKNGLRGGLRATVRAQW